MAQEANNFMTIKFENHKIPEFKEVKGKDWVYYGEDNKYPEYLIELALRSAKHGAILTGKTNYIYGGGLEAKEQGSNLVQRAKANEFIRQLNKDGFIRKMIQDFEWFNGFYVEPIWNKAFTKLVSINYIPFSKIRVNPDETEFYYSNDWGQANQSPEKTGLKTFTAFDPNKPGKDQIFYYKLISPKNGKDRNVYPVPEYIGACASIETDIEIANYHLNNIKTGFSVGTIINFNNGVPEDEAKKQIEQSIKRKFQGTDKAGSVAITFNNTADNAPTITSFAPSDLDKQFIEIGKRVEQDIFTGHKITSPMLFGVKTEGQLGGRTEMIDAYELFQNTYVNIRQGLLEDVINGFAGLFGVTSKVQFRHAPSVSAGLTDTQINAAFTPDEVREKLGLPKLKHADTNETGKDIVNALNTLSPLVATKVLEAMSQEEIRGLIGLKGGLVQTNVTPTAPVQMNAEKDWRSVFAKYGKNTGGTIVKEIPIEFSENFNFAEYEANLISMQFASDLTPNEKAIIDLLSKDSLMPTKDIAKVLKISESEVNSLIKGLDDGGYLKVKEGEIIPKKSGENIVNNEGAKTSGMRVEYKYTWRPDVKERNVSHSRDFCVEMLDKSAAGVTYTSSDLTAMSNDLGTNVWEFRGGWWNRDGANVPYCRHIWAAVIKKD